MNGIVVSVDYGDYLARTLSRNAKHFERVYVLTSTRDARTHNIANRTDNAIVFQDDGFYENGALFNKGLVIERFTQQACTSGWWCIFDADVVLPKEVCEYSFAIGNLYSPYRRMYRKLEDWNGGYDWKKFPRFRDREFAGYCQIFNAEDPHLATRPWYGTTWTHAGGCDSEFQAKWPERNKIRLPCDVLHIGEPNVHWAGRSEEAKRAMQNLRTLRGKHGYAREHLSPPQP